MINPVTPNHLGRGELIDVDGEVAAQEAGERPPVFQAVPGGIAELTGLLARRQQTLKVSTTQTQHLLCLSVRI